MLALPEVMDLSEGLLNSGFMEDPLGFTIGLALATLAFLSSH